MSTVQVLYFGAAFFCGVSAALPDPYALDCEWRPRAHSREMRLYQKHNKWLRARNFLVHSVTTGFAVFAVALIFWSRVSRHSLTQEVANYIVFGSLAVGMFCVVIARDIPGMITSAAILWILTERFHVTKEDVVNWVTDLAALVALVVGVVVLWMCNSVAERWLRMAQYSLTAGFSVSFSVAFAHYGWHHYAHGLSRHISFWTPLIGALVAAAVIMLLQHHYKHIEFNLCCMKIAEEEATNQELAPLCSPQPGAAFPSPQDQEAALLAVHPA